MSVLLIDPQRSSIGKGNVWRAINRSLPTLGLAYIASFLEKKGIKVSIIDLKVQMLDIPHIIAILKNTKPDFVGITATTVQINAALEIAKLIKDFDKNINIVMGGPHPHIFAEDLLKLDSIDYVIRGEGEYTFWELVSGKNLSSIYGLAYKLNDDIISNPLRPPISDLDTLPFPARHLLPMDRYRPSPGRYRRLPATSIITSRGCPGKCTFCYTDILGQATRFRSARNIADEIKDLIERYKIKEISFYDDTFTTSRRNVRELCSIILNEKIDITWSCMSRVDCVDKQTLQMMKNAGCHLICYGVESGDETILNNINKKIHLEQAKEAVELTKKTKINVMASFMIGNPGETEETIKKTIRYALELDPDLYVFNITTPFPGTAMFNWAKEKSYLTTYNWDYYDLGHIVMQLPTISPNLIQYYYKYAYRRIYLRFQYMISHLKKINSLGAIKTNTNVFFKMLNDIIIKR